MALITNPVNPATQFIIDMNASSPTKEKGLEHLNQLIKWACREDRPEDVDEAVVLVSYLGQLLLKRQIIEKEDFEPLSQKLTLNYEKILQDVKSPLSEVTKKFNKLNKEGTVSQAEGVGLCNRLIQWLSLYEGKEDTTDYMGSITTIFSIAEECFEKELITENDKRILFNRAYQVIKKDPDRTIDDEDLVEFLKNQGLVE